NNVRVGGELLFVPSNKSETGGTGYKVGSDLSLDPVVEAVFPVSSTVALTLRGQGGIAFLFPGGDLQKDIDNERSSNCGQGTGVSCTVSGGPFVGYNYGLGGGILVGLDKVRIRGDILFQGYSLPYGDINASAGSNGVEVTQSAGGSRFWFLGGVE